MNFAGAGAGPHGMNELLYCLAGLAGGFVPAVWLCKRYVSHLLAGLRDIDPLSVPGLQVEILERQPDGIVVRVSFRK
ncbi:MAG: hypothetical protein ACKVYV_01535 [Limisphaerales bacterium]